MSATVYILQFNDEVLCASVNITTLHIGMEQRCKLDGVSPPEPYWTVRRYVNAEGKYTHEPRAGWRYRIIERQLVKKHVQHKLPLEQEAEPKQSNA